MASIDIEGNQAMDDTAHQTVGPAQPEIADLLGIARRGWLFLVAGTTIGLICALVIVSTVPPTYKASARIAFERTLPRYMQSNKVTNEPIIEDSDTLGQTYVIASQSILMHVVKSLSLASDPELAGPIAEAKDSETLGSRVRGLFLTTAKALGFPKEPSKDGAIEHHNDPEKIAFD